VSCPIPYVFLIGTIFFWWCYVDEEVKAVQIMAAAMRVTPQSYTLLHSQCDFLRSKGKFEWALKLARQAVNCAPSEFVTWEKLTELYMDLGQFESVGVSH
jgi:Chs5-Arf1p-binding protein BUD7/BCH1